MKGSLFIFIIYLFTSASTSPAGVNDMQPMGQGDIRYLGFMKIYEATLYAQVPLGKNTILDINTSKCLQLKYSVSLSTDDFILGANTILTRQQSPEKLGLLQTEIDNMHRAYRDVKKGDTYLLCYNAEKHTTTLALNGRELVSITSADFGAIYFGIWLGPVAPIDEELRDTLLADSGIN